MAGPSLRLLVFLGVASVSFLRSSAVAAAAEAASLCPRSDLAFLDDIRSQCPLVVDPVPPLEVSRDALDIELSRDQSSYHAVLFYASWCPFSSNIRPIFDALSSMFPQIRHLAVEESSATPSVFSRYGIHSFPAILLANGTTRVRYRGPKDLESLVYFYKVKTGHSPVTYLAIEHHSTGEPKSLWPRNGSLRDLSANEPYLVFGLLFICLKMLVWVFRVIFFHMKTFWVAHAWRLNVGIIRESNQLLDRVLLVMDVKRLWCKLRLCYKTRRFRKGANNARAWASSLTSVSLGESSSLRVSPADS